MKSMTLVQRSIKSVHFIYLIRLQNKWKLLISKQKLINPASLRKPKSYVACSNNFCTFRFFSPNAAFWLMKKTYDQREDCDVRKGQTLKSGNTVISMKS